MDKNFLRVLLVVCVLILFLSILDTIKAFGTKTQVLEVSKEALQYTYTEKPLTQEELVLELTKQVNECNRALYEVYILSGGKSEDLGNKE